MRRHRRHGHHRRGDRERQREQKLPFATTTTTTTTAGTATGTALSNKYTSLQSILLKYLPNIPGMHFLIGSIFCFIGWLISFYGLNNISNKNHPALLTKTR